jgi:hypothetical protein
MQTVRVEQLAQLLRDTILESEARERERIMQLIQEWQCYEDFCSCWTDNKVCENRDEVIALIKGEN